MVHPDHLQVATALQDNRSQPCVEGTITNYNKELNWPGAMSRQAGDGGEHQTARHDDIYLEHAVQESIKELGPIPRARRHYPDLPVELKVHLPLLGFAGFDQHFGFSTNSDPFLSFHDCPYEGGQNS